MSGIFTRAAIIAATYHADQKRKYTGDPYIVHPLMVAGLVREAYAITGVTLQLIEEVSAAAVLHDVLEDTTCPSSLILRETSAEVLNLVVEVTDVSRPSEGNRAARKALDRQHLARASAHAKSIKLADLMDNTRSITSHDPDFSKVYLREKALLLPHLSAGNAILFRWVFDQLVGLL